METLFIGKNQLFLTEVESTNTYAMDMLRNVNTPEGTLIHTDHQTMGRGQRGASWISQKACNLTLSVVLKPHFLSAEHSFFLSKISALALYDLLAEILPKSQYDIKIKWPNDILVNQAKIAGILIENNFSGVAIQHSVLGIGLNVNQTEFNGIENRVTSLKQLTGKEYSRVDVLERLCSYLEKWYFKLKEEKFTHIDDSYLANLYGFKHTLSFTNNNNLVFQALLEGVSPSGKLQLQTAEGLRKEYDLKEIRFVL